MATPPKMLTGKPVATAPLAPANPAGRMRGKSAAAPGQMRRPALMAEGGKVKCPPGGGGRGKPPMKAKK